MYKSSRLINAIHQSIFHQKKLYHKCSDSFKFSDEVAESLLKGSPVVALESTVITHGLPYPENLSTACKLEEIVRQNRTTPATIGVIQGVVHVGMTAKELEALASENQNTIKISRRDLPYMLSKGLSGGTTVAGTMALAYRAGISVFVTGGIGGVHRGAETSMDISADLYELSRTPMTVISAGVKSILDIGRTLEYLETLGVCVATFGASKEFPSFFTPGSEFSAACNVETVLDAARLIDARDRLGLESGILLAVPIPSKYHEDGFRTEAVIEEALEDARKKSIVGKDITPYVLNKVRELSQGASLRANVGLLENNADVGSQIAVELNEIQKHKNCGLSSRGFIPPVRHETKRDFSSIGRPVVIGGSILDIHVKALENIKMDGSTLNGKVESIAGGVGRNVADCLSRLQMNPLFISTMGALENARPLLNQMVHMDKSGITILPDAKTATCIVVLDKQGECISVIGDLSIHDSLSKEQIQVHQDVISTAPLVIIDGNIPPETMEYISDLCSESKVPVWFEPTDVSLASRPFADLEHASKIAYASPNLNELRTMYTAAVDYDILSCYGSNKPLEDILTECMMMASEIVTGTLHTLVVTLGEHGALLLTTLPPEVPFPLAGAEVPKGLLRGIHYSPPKPKGIVSVSGAGDCFAAGMIGSILRGSTQHECIHAGQRAAILSLASHHAVPDTVTSEIFYPKASDPVGTVSVVNIF